MTITKRHAVGSARLALGLALFVAPGATRAADYSWDGGSGAFKQWSSNENWVGDSVPISDASTRLFLTGNFNTGSFGGAITNDIASPFSLNYLEISGMAGSPDTNFIVAGNALRFTTNGATQPILRTARDATSDLYNPIEIAATALTFRASTYGLGLRSQVSGAATLIYDGPGGGAGGLNLYTANTFSGGLIYRAGTAGISNTWNQFAVFASGALGSGTVEVFGGNRHALTNYAQGSPGQNNYLNERTSGISFRNTTVQSNDFEIRQDSPLFAGALGAPSTVASVTLLGAIDLNTNGLWLRGPAAGTGTIQSNIFSTAGGGRLVKLDPGTWILNGSNSYQGRTDVLMGRLLINGDNRSATGLVTVAANSLLGGVGTVGGKTIFQAGATNSPGLSPGIQTFAGGVTYSNNAALVWELYTNGNALADRGIGFDGIDVTGGQLDVVAGADLQLVFNLGGTSNIVDWSDAFWAANQQWLLIDLGGTATTNGTTAEFDIVSNYLDRQGDLLSDVRPGAMFDTYYDVAGDVYLSYVIPEPSAWALLACGAGILFFARRRRG